MGLVNTYRRNILSQNMTREYVSTAGMHRSIDKGNGGAYLKGMDPGELIGPEQMPFDMPEYPWRDYF